MAIDIGAPGSRRADVAGALLGYIGALIPVPITGPTTYNPDDHLCRLLDLADGLGEVVITIPAVTAVGHSFAVASPATSWPRIVVGSAGAPVNPWNHTRGLPKGTVSVLVSRQPGTTAVVHLAGATQP